MNNASVPEPKPQEPENRTYDRRSLTYSNTFENPFKRNTIRVIEWMTGKMAIIRRIRRFEKSGAPKGYAFWPAAVRTMGIDLLTPERQLDRIPATGPCILVANHPHGLVDGMVLAELIGKRRNDFRILTRSILTGIDETASSYLIPVPFPHEEDAQRKMLEMRKTAMEFLAQGGLIALFPSGAVATSETWFGPAVEGEWNVFTAKMIRMSGASVLPVRFTGSNSRAYMIANLISPTLRQSLLLHEVAAAFDHPQAPIVGHTIDPAEVQERGKDPRAFMAWLRDHVLALKD